jgi:Carboxypeptidase regulatory-like domain
MARRTLPFKVEVSSPCTESWAAMTGDSRHRHCAACDRQVHDFAYMTPNEIECLVARTGGNLCGRLTRRSDGSLVTLPVPASITPIANFALAATLAVAPAIAFAQVTSDKQTASDKSAQQEATINSSASQAPSLAGTVRDATGAVIPGSEVTLMHGDLAVVSTHTDAIGQFGVSAPSGDYVLRVGRVGFTHISAPVSLTTGNTATAEVTLKPAADFTVQVTSSSPSWDATTGGVLAVYYGPWYKRLEFYLRHPLLSAKHIFHRY